MILTIKSIQHNTFKLEFDPEKTVLDLKKQIFLQCDNTYVVEKQKLIYMGTVLANDRTVKSYNVEENKCIVVLLMRGDLNYQAPEPSTPVAAPAPVNERIVAGNSAAEENPSNVASALQSLTIPHQIQSESNLVLGEDYNRSIERLMDMGYDHALVVQAMEASFNNPERAVEYLINGIPEVNAADSLDPFEFMRSNPFLQQIRDLVNNEPSQLAQVIEEIARTNPELLTLINEHQEDFVNMLNRTEGGGGAPAAADDEGAGAVGGGSIQNLNNAEQVINITLSVEDYNAINRLKGLGFTEAQAVEAYFACEKNEQLAANFLLSFHDE